MATIRTGSLVLALFLGIGVVTAGTQVAGQSQALVISPASVTLAPGGIQQFQTTLSGLSGRVRWFADGGTITSKGLFTAGQTPGTYRVIAYVVNHRDSRGTAIVTIGDVAEPPSPTPPPPPPPEPTASGCQVAGGTSSNPTALGSVINTRTDCSEFVLGNGYYASTTITREGVTVRALNRCQAQVRPELSIRGRNVTVDGVSVTAAGVAVTVYAPGVTVKRLCIQGFGKTQYGNGIWVFQEALNPDNRIRILDNTLDDWGGAQYSGGIAIGKANDNYSVPSQVSVEIIGNRITRGPTTGGIYNAAIQSFHPFVATHNYIDTVSGTSIQNKTFNSRIACNELVHVIGDGGLYNRLNSNNVWEYNYLHDSDFGIDHFMGDGTVFRGNVIANVKYFGRIKDQGIGSTDVLLERNTFYNSTAWAAFIWDATSGAPLRNILWRRNIFHTTKGAAINEPSNLDVVWDETDNIFWQAPRPTRTTGASGTSRTINPLISPSTSFAPQGVTGYGAPWPLPCSR